MASCSQRSVACEAHQVLEVEPPQVAWLEAQQPQDDVLWQLTGLHDRIAAYLWHMSFHCLTHVVTPFVSCEDSRLQLLQLRAALLLCLSLRFQRLHLQSAIRNPLPPGTLLYEQFIQFVSRTAGIGKPEV